MAPRHSFDGRLAQLGQDAGRAFRVEKGDPHVMGAGARRLVDHAYAGLLQFGDALLQARDGEGDVMKSLAPLFEERRDGTRRLGGLQQLKPDVADAEEADADLLV